MIVTSRDVALDRMRTLPGMLVSQAGAVLRRRDRPVLQTWNQSNAGAYAQRGLTPLTLKAVHRCAELAEQPLLLTMLALYGADGTQLQRPAFRQERGRALRVVDYQLRKAGGSQTPS